MADGISGLNNVNRPSDINTPYVSSSEMNVSVQDFLQLMIAQLKNQDFTNPVDDTQYVTQLAQFATMENMQELAYYSKTNYVMSLIGKDVTAASLSLGGAVNKVTGPVEKVSLVNNDFTIYVGGKAFTLDQIMSVNDATSQATTDADNAVNSAVVLLYRSSNSASLRWDPPSTDESVNSKYTYQVYYSTNKDMDSVEDVKKNGTLASKVDGSDNPSCIINSLDPNTSYFVNVIVTAPDGTEKVYQKLTFSTQSE